MPNPQIETTAYNLFGQVESVTDFENQKTEFVYDTLGRTKEKKLYADGSTAADVEITMTYDNDGRQEIIDDPRHGITQWVYDNQGRVETVATPEGWIDYEYDPTTNQKTTTETAKSRTEYLYDDLGRLEFVKQTVRNGITLPTEEVTQYGYDDNGSRKSITYANNVKTSYTYDPLGRLETLEHRDSGASLLRKYAYTLDTDGKRLGVVESYGPSQTLDPQLTINYQYDDLNRLIQEQSVIDNNPGSVIDTDRAFTHDYVYDTLGNRLSKAITGGETITYGYNNRNQLETESSSTASYSTAYDYDNNGAQTTLTRTGTDAETSTYGYSLDGRMDTSTINRNESGQAVALTTDYTYNPSGIRTQAQQTTFTVDTVAQTPSNRMSYGFKTQPNRKLRSGQVIGCGVGRDSKPRFVGEERLGWSG